MSLMEPRLLASTDRPFLELDVALAVRIPESSVSPQADVSAPDYGLDLLVGIEDRLPERRRT